jgi:hypothetical protein
VRSGFFHNKATICLSIGILWYIYLAGCRKLAGHLRKPTLLGPVINFGSGTHMHFSKFFFTFALALFLSGCSSSPSDGEIVKLVETEMQKGMAIYADAGIGISDLLAFDVKVTNKAKQDDGKWLIQTATTITAKKDFREFKKGQVMGQPQSTTFRLVKGDNGWMGAN